MTHIERNRRAVNDRPTGKAIRAAKVYRERGWKVIPIPGNSKSPVENGWPTETFDDQDFGLFSNIGIQFGEVSGGLCDVDLDCAEALLLADDFLPETGSEFGRESKPRAHRLYVSELYKTKDKAAIQFRDPTDGKMLLELRIGGGGGGGAQTMFPPSRHPTSGEDVYWEKDGDPTKCEGELLYRQFCRLAVAILLVLHYPGQGSREDAAMILGGVLARAKLDADELAAFVKVVARAARDDEVDKRVVAAVAAIGRLDQGKNTPGIPRFKELWGEAIATKVMEWLGLTSSHSGHRGASPLHTWNDPDTSLLDDRRGELPEFPIAALASERLQEWAEDAAHGSGTTVAHVVVPLLGIASGLIGTARRVQPSRPWVEPMTLWTAVVGFSGSGKTPGIDVSRRALEMVVHDQEPAILELQRQHEQKIEVAKVARKAWEAAVKKAKEDNRAAPKLEDDAKHPGTFIVPRLYTTDTTIEAMAVQLQARPTGMILIIEELARLLLNMNRYAQGSDAEFWLEAWDGKPYHQQRLGRDPVDLKHLLVGLVGGLQPDKLAQSFKGAADGMYARFLFAWPGTPPYRSLADMVDLTDARVVKMLARLAILSELPSHSDYIKLSPKAYRLFENLRHHVLKEAVTLDGREREWWSKIPSHVLRLAGTLAYLYWMMEEADKPEPATVQGADIYNAVDLVGNYFWPHARAALRQIGLNDQQAEARRVLRWIAASGKQEVSREEIRNEPLGRRLNAEATQELLQDIERAGWLRSKQQSTGGRPSTRWLVNPKLTGRV